MTIDMLQRGANVGLKRPFAGLTDFSAGGQTALDHMRPTLTPKKETVTMTTAI